MGKQIKKLLLLFLFLFPLIGYALQLGKIMVISSQGQPLNAEIEMFLAPGEDTSKLQTSLASKENYESQGIERLPIHNNISIELQKNEKGLIILKLKSTQPVPEPFLDLLIQVDSAKGRNYREYTVLLDPPETGIIKQEKLLVIDKTDPPLMIEKKDARESIKKNKNEIEKENKSSFKSSEKYNSSDSSTKSITVKYADTIYKIARENKIPGITTEQMVIGIFNLNELAFINKNINGLGVGQKIVLPSKDDFVNLSHAEAMAEIKIQSTQWNKFSSITAEAVGISPKIVAPKSNIPVTSTTIDQTESATPVSRIKLTGESYSMNKNSKEIAQKEINQINDDKTALEKNIKVAQQKIILLEKELTDAKKILAISNQALFELQEKSKQINQTKDFATKDPMAESKTDLNSLISKPNDLDINKNEVISPTDTTFKSSISDGPLDEKTSAQLASDKEVPGIVSSSELYIFLGVLLAILMMLFVIKIKKQQEQKELIDSINTNEDKPEMSSIKGENELEKVDLSDVEINLSNKDQKSTHLD